MLILTYLPGIAQQAPFSTGVNLTGWFQTGSAQEVQLNRYNLTDFEQIKSLGCDVIRWPVDIQAMTNGAPNYLMDPLFFSFMDSVVFWAEKTDMHLILDNHTFDPAIDTPDNIGQFLKKVWPQIAYRYRNAYDKLYFEILNEPHGIADGLWNSIQQEVIDLIRQVDTKHTLIIGPAGWNSYQNLKYMPVYEDPKLIYTFHFYDPFLFTHQGASWTDPSMEPLGGVPFPYDPANMPAFPPSLNGSWIQSAFNNYHNEGTAAKVKELIDIAVSFSESRNVPVFCGEFGVYIPNADPQQRINWYQLVREYLEQHDIAWTIWDYHGGFGVFEEGGNGLFDYDLNTGLIDALDWKVPDQSEFMARPDSTGFIIYDDFIGKNIFHSSYTSGNLSIYDNTQPKQGAYCIEWTNPVQYNFVGFDFQPNKDLSQLLASDYQLRLWIRGNQPQAQLDIRFMDTKTGPADHPWRMRTVIDPATVTWDGSWQELILPLKDFREHGAWDNNQWYEPTGAFDWTAIDRLEIVNEYGVSQPVEFGFDQIALLPGATTATEFLLPAFEVFPNPADDHVYLRSGSQEPVRWQLTDVYGNRMSSGWLKAEQKLYIPDYLPGLYIITFFNTGGILKTSPIIITPR